MRILGGKGALVLAVVLGLATSYVSWSYVQQAGAPPEPIATVPVLVAREPVGQRTVITPTMVQVRQVPTEGRTEGAFTDPSHVVGRVSKHQLAPGEQLMPHQFFLQREQSGLAFIIPESHRGIAVAVSEVIGSGGLIIPGDRVDIFALFDLKEDSSSASTNGVDQAASASSGLGSGARLPERNTMIALVLQDVEVLAVAQQLEGEDTRGTTQRLADQVVEGRANGAPPQANAQPQPQARTVTLSVTPSDAARLVLAEERGKIRLALRPAAEQGPVDVPPLELWQVLQTP